MMKKMFFAIFVLALSISCASASALVDGNVSLGQHNNMVWYMVGYEKAAAETGAPGAIVRRYYGTNAGYRSETVELLMSKFNVKPEIAGGLYFTEYRYVYSADFKTFIVTYIRHHGMAGELIHETEFTGLSEATKPPVANIDAKGPSGLALDAVRKIEKIPAPKK